MLVTFPLTARRALLTLLAPEFWTSRSDACQHQQSNAEVVVIVATATRNEPGVELAPPDLGELCHAALTAQAAAADVADPNTGQPTTVTLTHRRSGGRFDYGTDWDTLLAEILAQALRLVSRKTADGPSNLLFLPAEAAGGLSMAGTSIGVSSVQSLRHRTSESLPGIFQLNSAQLLRSADSSLSPLVGWAVSDRLWVAIQEVASSGSHSPAYNQAHSLVRTRAIRVRLTTASLPSNQIVQLAESLVRKIASGRCRLGHFGERARAEFRCVVIFSPIPWHDLRSLKTFMPISRDSILYLI